MKIKTAGRKFKSVIIALCLALGLGAVSAAYAAEGLTFVLSAPKELPGAGDSFDVAVALKNNPGFGGFRLRLDYDMASLECTAVEAGELLSEALFVGNPEGADGAYATAALAGVAKGDGELVRFGFKVKKAGGSAEFKLSEISISDNEDEEMAYSLVSAVLEPGTSGGASGGGSASTGAAVTTGIATPSEESAPKFDDIAGSWAEEYILRASELGLVEGYQGHYRPLDKMSRAEFVTILKRAVSSENEPSDAQSPDAVSFSDVPSDSWYAEAVSWASRNGIVNGIGGGKFDPLGNVTREQIAAILFRLSGSEPGMSAMLSSIYDAQYPDSAELEWSKSAVYWAVYNAIYCGESSLSVGERLAGAAASDRSQIAVMMVRYLEDSDIR